MGLDKKLHYIYRFGSSNQYRLHWNGNAWHYECLAGGVLFDDQKFKTEDDLVAALGNHGINTSHFTEDTAHEGEAYSAGIQTKIKQSEQAGLTPCAKHGLVSKNADNTCEACENIFYPDDFRGTEG